MLALLSTIDNQNEIFAKGYKRPRAFQPGAANDQQVHNNDGFFNDLPLAKQSKKKQGIRFSQKLSKEAKFMFSKKATKIDEIFTIDLTLTTYIMSNRR